MIHQAEPQCGRHETRSSGPGRVAGIGVVEAAALLTLVRGIAKGAVAVHSAGGSSKAEAQLLDRCCHLGDAKAGSLSLAAEFRTTPSSISDETPG